MNTNTEVVVSAVSDFTTGDGTGPAFSLALSELRLEIGRSPGLVIDGIDRVYLQYIAVPKLEGSAVVKIGRIFKGKKSVNIVAEVNQSSFVKHGASSNLLILTDVLATAIQGLKSKCLGKGISASCEDLLGSDLFFRRRHDSAGINMKSEFKEGSGSGGTNRKSEVKAEDDGRAWPG